MKSMIERYFQQRSFAHAALYSSIVNKLDPYEVFKPYGENMRDNLLFALIDKEGDHSFDDDIISEMVSMENLMFSMVHTWFGFGRNTFKLTEGLSDLLAYTDVLDMHIDFSTLPFECFYLDFSSFPKFKISQNGSEHIFEGVFVHNLQFSNFINFYIIKRNTDGGRLSGNMFFAALTNSDTTISQGIESFRDIMKGWDWHVDDTARFMMEIGPLIFNTLLYLKSDNPDIERVNNNSSHTLHKLNANAKTLAILNLLSTGKHKYFNVGTKYNSIFQDQSFYRQSSTEKRTHWRRGHWRHYNQGKIIFIMLTKVRADREDPLIGKDFTID